MSRDSTDWKDELADELGVDPSGIDLVDRVVERKIEEGEVNSDDLLSRLSRRDVLSAGAGAVAGAGLLSSGTTTGAADVQYPDATGTIGTENVPIKNVYAQTTTTEQLGAETVQSTTVNTESINSGVEFMDPDTTDFATALSDAVSRASVGDTIIVPTDYAECSGATVTKEVTIRSLGNLARFYSDTVPTITKTADAPCIEGGDDVDMSVIGISFDASGVSDTTPAVVSHGTTYIDSCKANEIGGGAAFRLGQDTAGDNLNLSQVLNVSAANCSGDVVLAENTTGNANNINSLRVHVQDHRGNAGWAINTGQQDANASWFLVNRVQDTTTATAGGIRMNSQRCVGRVMRHGGSGPVYQFEEPINYGEVFYDLTGNGAIFNNSNNVYQNYGGNGLSITIPFGGFTVTGSPIQTESGQVDFGTNGARIFVNGSGELVAEDEQGNTTIIT